MQVDCFVKIIRNNEASYLRQCKIVFVRKSGRSFTQEGAQRCFYYYSINSIFGQNKMRKKCLLVILLLLLIACNNGYCATEIVEKEKKQGSTTTELDNIGVISPINFPKITKLLKSTGIVIVIIVVTVYFLRKKFGIKTGMSGRKRYVHIVDTVPLGPKKYVHLVKVPGRVLLIGATSERIQALTEITEKDIVESIETESKSGEFMKFFKRAYTERT